MKLVGINCHADNWYPAKASIAPAIRVEDSAIYIAMDVSGSMSGTRMATQKAAVAAFVRGLKGTRNSVKIVTWDSVIEATIERFDCNDDDYEAIAVWVTALSNVTSGATNFAAAVSLAAAFFGIVDDADIQLLDRRFGGVATGGVGRARRSAARKMIFLTDGLPTPTSTATTAAATLAAIEGLSVSAFNIDLADTTWTALLDNTPSDGVPVISGTDVSALQAAMAGNFLTHADMNAAHILRAVIVDPRCGGSGDATEIGDSFTAAADLFFEEEFGLSIYWENPGSRDEFLTLIRDHVGAATYVDRLSGKWEIKPIRDDYDIGSLPVFDRSNIIEWIEATRPEPHELPNQVTVTYTKRENGEPGSVTLTNVAGVQALSPPRVIATKVEMPAITQPGLAARVCQRELVARTTRRLAGAIRVMAVAPGINQGWPIIVHEPEMGIDPTVVRVTEIEDGFGTDNSVVIRFVQDGFSLGDTIIVDPDSQPVLAALNALPSIHRLVEEAPYYALVLQTGQGDVDAALASEPDVGFLQATGIQPTGAHIDATVTVDTGAGWVEVNETSFAPVALLLGPLSALPNEMTVAVGHDEDLAEVEQGSLCAIGAEYLRVDNMVRVGDVVTLTLGRGCLDTVPAAHLPGSAVIFWQGTDIADARFLVAETPAVKLRTKTSADQLRIAEAPTDIVTFASRAIRPYPPGNFKVSGSYVQELIHANIILTWAHRDRTIQTTLAVEDHTAGNIGPEPGVTYRVRAIALDGDKAVISTVVDVNVGSATTYDYDDTTVLPGGAEYIELSVTSVRAGYESWQRPTIRASATIGDPLGFEDSADTHATLDDHIRKTED